MCLFVYLLFIYHKIPIITLHITHTNLQLAIFFLRDFHIFGKSVIPTRTDFSSISKMTYCYYEIFLRWF